MTWTTCAGFQRQPTATDDEPEVAILVLACAIGLATGAGVVLFNDGIHAIRHFVWAGTPLEATYWGRWARHLDMATSWPIIVFPPTIGGLLVGILRRVSGGLEDPPHIQPAPPPPQAPAASTTPQQSGAGGNNIMGSVVTALLESYDEENDAKGNRSAEKRGRAAGSAASAPLARSAQLTPFQPSVDSAGS